MSSPQGPRGPINYIWVGIGAGFLLALLTILFNFWGALYIIVFAAIGGVIGAHFQGAINLRQIFEGFSRGGRG